MATIATAIARIADGTLRLGLYLGLAFGVVAVGDARRFETPLDRVPLAA
jgi:hypothetical protein